MSLALIGSFYFKRTVNGNLLGEFSNNLEKRITTESGNLNNKSSSFLGNYQSTWNDGTIHSADLVISQKTNTNERIFILEWKESSKLIYQGEGFMCGDTLIGYYTKAYNSASISKVK